MKLTKLALSIALGLSLVGCGAGDAPYDTLVKDKNEVTVTSLSDEAPIYVDGEVVAVPIPGLWLYRPSTSSAPRNANMLSYYESGEQLVKLHLTRDGLTAVKVDNDIVRYVTDANGNKVAETSRWEDQINATRVFVIPGEYTSYRCKEDDYDECTNAEEKVPELELEWWERSYFTPDYSEFESYVTDVNEQFSSDAKSSEVTHKQMDTKGGVINLEIQRHFKDDIGKANFFYSLVRLDLVSDPQYTPVYASVKDKNTFGFFTTDFEKADIAGSIGNQDTKGSYVARFSPNKDSIDYYLSDSFFKPGNEKWLQATKEAFAIMATQMKEAGIPPLHIINPSAPSGVVSGDLRYNAINLFSEPLNVGLLGYGPSAQNPLTGETISAYTNMYPGVIKSGIYRQWNQFASLYNEGSLGDHTKLQTEIKEGIAKVQQMKLVEEGEVADKATDTYTGMMPDDYSKEMLIRSQQNLVRKSLAEDLKSHPAYNELSTDALKPIEDILAEEKRKEFWSRNNMFSSDNLWVSSTEKKSLPGFDFVAEGFIDKTGDFLKPWEELNDVQKQKVIDVFGVHNYKTTLIHEVGHNLGLRHNFKGSSDKANFYSEERAAELGLRGAPAASSIMDYAPSELDIEPLFGSYDIAALRYAYNREVEDSTGSFHSLKDFDVKYSNYFTQSDANSKVERSEIGPIAQLSLHLEQQGPATEENAPIALREYQFCTDGNVGSTWSCDRFDEGTTPLDNARYHFKRFTDIHEQWNFRGEDFSFRENNTVRRYFFMRNQLQDVAVHGMNGWGFVEAAAEFNGWSDGDTFGTAMCEVQNNGEPRWPVACEQYTAAQKAGKLLVNVLATPEKTCQVKLANGTFKNFELKDVYSWAARDLGPAHTLPTSCFDETLNDYFANNKVYIDRATQSVEIYAELNGGQFLNNQTAWSTENQEYSDWTNYDEIDAFGVWFYRPIAAELLANRNLIIGGSSAPIDIPSVKAKVDELISHWLTGSNYSGYFFVDKDGKEVTSMASYSPDYTKQLAPRLLWPESSIMNWFAQTNLNQESNLVGTTIKQLVKSLETEHPDKKFRTYEQIQALSVFKKHAASSPKNTHLEIELNGEDYTAGPLNKFAYSMISEAKTSQIFAQEKVLDGLSSLTPINEFLTSKETAWQNAVALVTEPTNQTRINSDLQRSNLQIANAGFIIDAANYYKKFYMEQGQSENEAFGSTLLQTVRESIRYQVITSAVDSDSCMFALKDHTCIVNSRGTIMRVAENLVAYPFDQSPEYVADAIKVSNAYTSNFLTTENLANPLFPINAKTLEAYRSGGFEELKYKQIKMLDKLAVEYY
ncbi:zinc-dependent metalloprotease [Motilimonas cestriensis]|uniref:Zinc-dependent metalloprotease n=1 Tax=Motilimonas cestriensis TaxID=2742685 RepID=A0ABS8W7K9_9GAMM|nr:zinc-dependent metalloprotease [Motilimonas cestriensis]MCE2593501.1 zinc-dependent metalloprotease [Motilimonas cestriensis]